LLQPRQPQHRAQPDRPAEGVQPGHPRVAGHRRARGLGLWRRRPGSRPRRLLERLQPWQRLPRPPLGRLCQRPQRPRLPPLARQRPQRCSCWPLSRRRRRAWLGLLAQRPASHAPGAGERPQEQLVL
ncbi:hypothetical protein IWW57_006253, partial [Coemansia sp. S610]